MRQTARRFCSNPGCLFRAAVQSKLRSVLSSRSDRMLIIPRRVRVYNNVQSIPILLSSGAFDSEQTERYNYYVLVEDNVKVDIHKRKDARRRTLQYPSRRSVHSSEASITNNR